MQSSKSFFSSLRFKLWRRRMSVSAPKMAIKSQKHWLWRIVLMGLTLMIGGGIAIWTGKLGSAPATPVAADHEQLISYREQFDKIRMERDQLSATVNAAESQLNMERAAQKQLVTQVKTLEKDNVKLKEDLAFFESLLPADTGAQGVSIRRLKAEAVGPNQLHYQLLIMHGGKSNTQFVGNLQLAVSVVQGGKNAMINFPEARSDGNAAKFKLSFKHYQRVEGVLSLPDGVSIKAIQARILDNGQVRTQLSVNL